MHRIGDQYPVQAVALQRRHGTRVARSRVDPSSAHPVGGFTGSEINENMITLSFKFNFVNFYLLFFA